MVSFCLCLSTASTGEHTRGMCVIDRRSEGMAGAPEENRAALQAALIKASDETHKRDLGMATESKALDSVEVHSVIESDPTYTVQRDGVPVVTRTPGPDVLLKLLFERVWGA